MQLLVGYAMNMHVGQTTVAINFTYTFYQRSQSQRRVVSGRPVATGVIRVQFPPILWPPNFAVSRQFFKDNEKKNVYL